MFAGAAPVAVGRGDPRWKHRRRQVDDARGQSQPAAGGAWRSAEHGDGRGPGGIRDSGAIQIAVPTTGVGEDRAKHFARALMHFVRIHPAVGMVSEVRDAEAAREVLQFIATGHQVWTTIHVADANGILFRMLDMGVEAAEVCGRT